MVSPYIVLFFDFRACCCSVDSFVGVCVYINTHTHRDIYVRCVLRVLSLTLTLNLKP